MENTALDELLHAPGAVGGSGYDPVTGKYLPLRRQAAALSASPPPPAAEQTAPAAEGGAPQPAPPVAMTAAELLASSTRSTRRSQPIHIPLTELMRDPGVGSVAGRWSEELGRYVAPARQKPKAETAK